MSSSSRASAAGSTASASNSASAASTTAQSSAAAASSSLASQISSSIAQAVSSSITQQQGSTTTVEPSSTNVVTSIVSAASADPTTKVITSVVTQSAVSNGVTNTNPVTVVVTSVNSRAASTTYIPVAGSTSASSASSTSAGPSQLANGGTNGNITQNSKGLSTGGKTAIAVVIPVAFVALLVALGIWFWRKRKQSKDNQEQRRKEIDEYGYNPNNDPTLPAVGGSEQGAPQMVEDNSGYRGWGAAAGAGAGAGALAARKTSTTLSGSNTLGQPSETGYSYNAHSPGSPGAAYSDGHSGDPLVHNQRDTMSSDELGALGAAPLAVANPGMRRGPSNASSAYSAGARSDGSDEPVPQIPIGQAYGGGEHNLSSGGYGYGQHGPYGDGSYGGGAHDGQGMPVVRDVSARRNTRIQQAGSYQQGNSGIAQNF
ncbi:hypothetical protein LTR62_007333 [Meristemomyces frigidus]|uniref:Uncharacterized protein n=1 Tax=Meristemomyces frigidus TaxID=1508187 RepID=A0AAN7YT59_9PEZI|nr:hypothetical protein LTR62_007333 [Meristemomyces frigidus]